MPTHDDDDLDLLAGLSASRDDGPGNAKPAQRPAPKTKAEKIAPEPAAPSAQGPADFGGAQAVAQPAAKGGKGLLWFMFVLLLIVIGACAWLGQQVMQLQQQQAASSNALQLERSRVESISAQVHETGSSFAETGNVLESKFTFFESEIRKLWDVSNKRNKKDIATNTKQLTILGSTFKKSQQGLQSGLNSLTSEQAETSQAVAKFNKQLASENTALRASLEQQSEQLLLMSGEVEVLQQRLNSVPNDLSKRVALNEDAVQAIDESRRQLVNRITQLQKRVDDLLLHKPSAP